MGDAQMNSLTMKRGYQVALIVLIILPAVCTVYFVYLAIDLLGTEMGVELPRQLVRLLSILLFLYPVPVVILVLYTVAQLTQRLTYGPDGLHYHTLFRKFSAAWDELRHAYQIGQTLHVKTAHGSFAFPLNMYLGDVESFRSHVPAERWLDAGAAQRYRLKRSLPVLILIGLLVFLLLWVFQRYIEQLMQVL